ncbi:hypothetical protein EON80_23800 [bacterium]|nr:MAG: hypothetical protein EON80_23800 [bacterium]
MKDTSASHQSSPNLRPVYGVVAVLGVLALAQQAAYWIRTGAVDWGSALSLSGLLVFTITSALDAPRGALRLFLLIVAVLSTACAFLFFW